MFSRLLIANRGEIAVRISRACREMGIRSVAVYSDPDADSLHVREADEAFPLGGSESADSYLNIARIVEAARRAACQAIHPGYGFLSESPEFAAAVEAAGLTFIGPGPETLRRVGDKTEARALMRRAGVSIVPGFETSAKRKGFAGEAERLGYPVLVKAAGGGGGRGMRVVGAAEDLAEALESARREAAGAFGDGRVFLEKYIPGARHVEFQVLGDHEGNVIHLFERECSIQRRYQKILEEAPSPLLTDALRERMGSTAVAAAKVAGYRNAGTVEFLVDPDAEAFYFLEINARLQVEHPVTEMLTGIDLVMAQVRIAAGERLPFAPSDLRPRGHALECRLYAEDPAAAFGPSPGRILRFIPPQGPGIRVDAGYGDGDEVPIYYDPMIAKVIVAAEDRAGSIRRMLRALEETAVLGVTTNLPFLRAVLAHPIFARGEAATDFLARHFGDWSAGDPPDEAIIAATLAESGLASPEPTGAVGGAAVRREPECPWNRQDGFRMGR